MGRRRGAKGRRKRREPKSPSASPASSVPSKVQESREGEAAVSEAALGAAWAAALFVLALLVRVLVVVQLSDTTLYQSPQLDHLEFLRWAQSLGGPQVDWLPTHGPGYPRFLGAALALVGGSLTGARIVQAVMGAGLCVLVAFLGARLHGRWQGLAAGLLLALYGPLVYVESGFLAEGLFLFLLAAMLWVLTLPSRPVLTAAVAGLALGLATVVRATALALLPVLAVLLLLQRRRQRRGAAAAAFAAGWLVVVAPVAVAVGERVGSSFFLQGFGGLNFYMGNDPLGNGTPSARLGGDWDRLSGEAFRQGYVGAAAQERYYLEKGWEAISARPLATLGVLAKKAVWLIQDQEIRESHSFYFFRERSAVLRWLPGWGLLFPLAVLGLFLAARKRRVDPALVLYLAVFTASCVLLVVSSRYRLPLVPVLTVYAGVAVVWLVRRARERRLRECGLFVGAGAVLFLLTQLWTHAPSHDFTEELALTASSLERDGDARAAAATYRQALELDPGSAYAWAGLGRVEAKSGDLAAAEAAFQKAIAANPDYPRGHEGMASVYQQRGQGEEAVRAYRRALFLAPERLVVARDLGALLLELGRPDEAEEVYRQIVTVNPRDAAAHLALARIAGARQDPRRGMEMASRAAELDSDDSEAWLLLAFLATDAGEVDRAAEALDRASFLLGPEAPQVRLGRAALLRRRGELEAADGLLRDLLRQYPGSRQAAVLFVDNATDLGRRAEALAFLRSLQGGP